MSAVARRLMAARQPASGGGGGGTPPAYGTLATAGNGSGATLVISRPTSTANGEVLLAAINKENTAAITAPSGWALLGQSTVSLVQHLAVFYKIASSEPTTWTWSWTGSTWRNGWVARYTGGGTPTIGTFSADGGTGTTVNCPGITVVANTLVVAIGGMFGDRTWTQPTGMTKRALVFSGNERTVGLADVAQAGAGATGDKAFSLSGSEQYRQGALVAIPPV